MRISTNESPQIQFIRVISLIEGGIESYLVLKEKFVENILDFNCKSTLS
jgi:hypothetical protein